jgi:hypothetical protein
MVGKSQRCNQIDVDVKDMKEKKIEVSVLLYQLTSLGARVESQEACSQRED